MKIIRLEPLIERGSFPLTEEFKQIETEVRVAVDEVKWPTGSDRFTLNNHSKQCNGVTPIKTSCVDYLVSVGWKREQRMKITSKTQPGNIDVIKELSDGRYFALEWETGNISSSHRALNKMAIGMIDSILAGGILILPSRAMYYWLTDRIGNYSELEPYFRVWKSIQSIRDGYLGVLEVEHDDLSPDVPRIAKGTDGRALR